MVSYFELFGPQLVTGSEKDLLHLHLKLARDALVFKVEGLSEADRRRPMVRTGTNLIGVIKHMTWIESWYLCDAFGRERPALPWEADDDARCFQWSDMYAKPEETTDELLAAYAAATAAADRSIEELDLDATGMHPAAGINMSLRSLLLIVVMDTTRHAGHSDIVRELIDGATGSRHAQGSASDDEEHRAKYLARVRGEIDSPTWWTYIRSRFEAGG